MENIIECNHLTHYYGERKIYEDLCFNVPKGRILGLLGKNGTGKTTTINILSGYLKPKSGECRIFGQNIQEMAPSMRKNIGLLIEGHVQYQFMTIKEIERFYSAFYKGQWKKEAYYELMAKLKVAEGQRINKMSCGQRSQVALGLILAQNPELLILDDFSLGLDPGYRRLFVDYLKDYASAENKTVFLTSHIIQDMERLIDDCIVMDYGRILIQCPVHHLMNDFFRYEFRTSQGEALKPLKEDKDIYHLSSIRNKIEFHSFLRKEEIISRLESLGIQYENFISENVNLEDAFIGLTGKY